MRVLQAGMIVMGLPLLWAAAPADTAPEAALRLTPRGEAPVEAPPRPPVAASASPQPLSFGLQKISYPAGVTATFAQVYGNLRGFRPLTLDL